MNTVPACIVQRVATDVDAMIHESCRIAGFICPLSGHFFTEGVTPPA